MTHDEGTGVLLPEGAEEMEKGALLGTGAGVLPVDFDFEAHKKLVSMQPGDVPTTYADATALERDFGFTPKITLREGLRKFAEWYASFYMSKDYGQMSKANC